jgi:hypothetical protein
MTRLLVTVCETVPTLVEEEAAWCGGTCAICRRWRCSSPACNCGLMTFAVTFLVKEAQYTLIEAGALLSVVQFAVRGRPRC